MRNAIQRVSALTLFNSSFYKEPKTQTTYTLKKIHFQLNLRLQSHSFSFPFPLFNIHLSAYLDQLQVPPQRLGAREGR